MQARDNIPRYTQIAGALRAKLEAGDWPVGSRLPAIDRLAEMFEVAPQTMRQALSVLEGEGLILRRQGIGTIVKSEPRKQRWLSLPTDWASLVGMLDGLEPRRLLLEHADQAPHLQEGEGNPAKAYKYLKRVHYHEDKPFCLIEIYLSAEIYMQKPKAFRENIVVPMLVNEIPGLEIDRVRQSLRVDVADGETAKHLDIAMAGPIARVRRTITDVEGTIIYVADVAYRGDVIALEMDLSPPSRPEKPKTNRSKKGGKG